MQYLHYYDWADLHELHKNKHLTISAYCGHITNWQHGQKERGYPPCPTCETLDLAHDKTELFIEALPNKCLKPL